MAHGHSWYINHSGTADMGRIDATDPIERVLHQFPRGLVRWNSFGGGLETQHQPVDGL